MMAGSSRWGGVLLPVLLLLLLQGKGIHSFYIGSLSRMSRAAVRKFPMAGGVEVQRAPSLKSTLLEEEETITATIVQEEEAEVVEISEGMPIIQDVEDTLVDSGDVRAAPYRDVEDEAEEDEEPVGAWEQRMRDLVALGEDGQVAFSSRTMQVLREEGRAVLTKAGESLRSLGTYAASRAIADTGLVLRVTAVVAAEVVAEIGSRITPLLLPSAKAAETSDDDDTTSEGEVKLTLKEKIDLAALGIFQPGSSSQQSQFLLRSFSSAGNKDALIEDMYRRRREKQGVVLPEKLGALRIPLKVAAALPMLPQGLLQTANKMAELGKEASGRSTTKHMFQALRALPVLSATASASRRLASQASKRTAESRAANRRRALRLSGNKERPEQQATETVGQAVVAAPPPPTFLQEPVWAMQQEDRSEEQPSRASSSSSDTWHAVAEHGFANDMHAAAVAADVAVAAVVEMEAPSEWKVGEVRRMDDSSSTSTMASGGGGAAVLMASPAGRRAWSSRGEGGSAVEVFSAEDDGVVIDTSVEQLGEAKAKADDPLVLVLLLKTLDIALLGMEKVVLDLLPAAVGGMVVASRRLEQLLTGPTGKPGWRLLPSLERPMRAAATSSGTTGLGQF